MDDNKLEPKDLSAAYTKEIGSGNEIHQRCSHPNSTLTTQQGTPISDNQNSLKVGAKGPVLLEDMILRDKLFHFDHERIPERVVHARGFGVHGFFETEESLSEITRADIFQRKGEKTPVFVRFSTVAGNKGSADLARDVRGFAVKFYTKEGNWDLVGNNIPVFFIQDAMKFPDLVHAAKEEPDTGFPQAQTAHDNFWDFISLMPESMHMIMWIMSDRAIPRSFRFMQGFGVHTFKFINLQGQSKFVKFHWRPKLGLQSVLWNEAIKINGADPDFHRRDLWQAIQAKNYPEWELGLQLFDDNLQKKFPFDVLDATKIIPEEIVPLRTVGRLVLDRCVDNFFAETEQVAFCTQNIVPGIDFSDDPLLQGRNFSYLDTQLKRLGSPNFSQLPINAPKCPVRLFQRDGHMATTIPKGRVNYEPNSWAEHPIRENNTGFQTYPESLQGEKLRYRSESFGDHYSQARQFYISQTVIEQRHLKNALAFELSKVERADIRRRMVSHLLNIDKDLAKKVATDLGFEEIPKPAETKQPINQQLSKSDALSILLNGPKRFEGRKLGVLLTNHADADLFSSLKKEVYRLKSTLEVISPTIGGIQLNNGEKMLAQHNLESGLSVFYDAVAIIIADDRGFTLTQERAVSEFIWDAFHHHKFIAHNDTAISLFKKIGFEHKVDEGVMLLNSSSLSTFLKACGQLRYWQRELQLIENE